MQVVQKQISVGWIYSTMSCSLSVNVTVKKNLIKLGLCLPVITKIKVPYFFVGLFVKLGFLQ